MRIYVTQHWGTRGIVAVDGAVLHSDGKYFETERDIYRAGSDAFDNAADARAWVEIKAAHRVKALRQQIDRISREWLGGDR